MKKSAQKINYVNTSVSIDFITSKNIFKTLIYRFLIVFNVIITLIKNELRRG